MEVGFLRLHILFLGKPVILYGIPNCDTVRKACKFLTGNAIVFEFFDFKKQILTKSIINEWLKFVKWQDLLNKRSLTWRNLSENDRIVVNKITATQLMVNNPTLIKRPVLLDNNKVIVGFDKNIYQQLKNTSGR